MRLFSKKSAAPDETLEALRGEYQNYRRRTAAQLERYRQQAAEFGGVDRLARALDICGALVAELRNSSDARLSVEIAMTRLTRPDSELTLEALAERIEALELLPSMGAAPQPAFGATPFSAVADEAELEPVVSHVAKEPPVAMPGDDTPPWEDAAPATEPAPVAEPEPAPAAGSAVASAGQPEMSTERLLAAVLAVVRREDAATGALLSGVSLAEEDGQYHLLFPTGSEFQMRVVNGPDAKALINKAFAEALGNPVSFDCRIGSFSGLSAQAAPLTSEPPVSFADDARVDDSYFESLVAERSTVPADEMPADFADALSAFGAGVKVHEINDEE